MKHDQEQPIEHVQQYVIKHPSDYVREALRDSFATAAMSGMVASITTSARYYEMLDHAKHNGFTSVSAWIASDSYKQADAMLAAREA